VRIAGHVGYRAKIACLERGKISMIQSKLKWVVFSLVAVAVFMSTLDSSIVNIALPVIMADLNIPITQAEWIPMIYLLIVSALLLIFGHISDRHGRRLVYCCGFIGFTVGSLLCALSGSAAILIASRGIQGVGAAMLMACSPAIVVDVFLPQERGRAMGLIGTVVAAGLTVGPVTGGMLLNYFSWRVIFYINLPIGIVSTVAAFLILGRVSPAVGRPSVFDWRGSMLFILACASSIGAISHLTEWGVVAWRFWGLMGLGAAAFIAFYRVEKQIDDPIMAPALLKHRMFLAPAAAALVLYLSLFMMIFIMPFYLMHPAGFSTQKAGLLMVTPFACLFVVSPVSGALYDRIGSRVLCTVGMAILALSLYWLAMLDARASMGQIIGRLALMGAGTAIFTSPNSAAIMNAAPMQYRGAAAAAVATARNMGMVIGVAAAGLIFNDVFARASGQPAFHGYEVALAPAFMVAYKVTLQTAAGIAVAGAFMAFFRGADTKAAT